MGGMGGGGYGGAGGGEREGRRNGGGIHRPTDGRTAFNLAVGGGPCARRCP